MLERAVSDITFKLEAFALYFPSYCTRMSITSPVVSTQSLYSQVNPFCTSLAFKVLCGERFIDFLDISMCSLIFNCSYHFVSLQFVFKDMIIERLGYILLQHVIN